MLEGVDGSATLAETIVQCMADAGTSVVVAVAPCVSAAAAFKKCNVQQMLQRYFADCTVRLYMRASCTGLVVICWLWVFCSMACCSSQPLPPHPR